MGDWKTHLQGLGLEIIRPARPPEAAEPLRLVEDAVRTAGLTDFLEAARHERATITVLVNDPDRFTDSRTALGVVLRVAEDQRFGPRVRVVFATGSHTFTKEQAQRHEEHSLPVTALQRWERGWHNAHDPHIAVPVGGVCLHHWIAESDFLLPVGSMEPHYFAGVTGAHKTLTVGVMSYDSLKSNHFHAMSTDARALTLDGNPVYEAIATVVGELVREGKRVFAVNQVLVGGRIVACTAGDPIGSLKKGLPIVRQIFARGLAQPVDLIVARVGPPLDKSLYQADKAIKNVESSVRDGGVILLEAACHEGVGIDRFVRMMERAPDHETALELVRSEGYRLGDHKAVRLRALSHRRGVRLGIVSSHLSETAARAAGIELFRSTPEAAQWALGHLGTKGRLAALVEDAGNMTLTKA